MGGFVKRVKKNPVKAVAKAAATGFTPIADLAGGAIDDITPNFQAPELPKLPGVDGALASDSELQNDLRQKRRGRAANILTGSRGLAPGAEGSLARKTLLGF